MLVMLDKAQRYGNKADFYTNSGLTEEDYDLTEREKRMARLTTAMHPTIWKK